MTAIIWHFLKKLPLFRDDVAATARRELKANGETISSDLNVIVGEFVNPRKPLGKNIELVGEGVGDIRKDCGRNSDLVVREVGGLCKDLGGLVIAVGTPRYVDYSPEHLPRLLRGENQ